VATKNPVLQRVSKGEGLFLRGLEQATWGGRREQRTTTLAALTHALRALGRSTTYADVMGTSGAAFRFQIDTAGPAPDAPNAGCGVDCVLPALEATGSRIDWHRVYAEDAADVRRIRTAVVASIDRGIPVLADSEECSLLVGYEKGGEVLLGRWYGAVADGYSPMKQWPWRVGVVALDGDPPARKRVIRASLHRAVELARAEKFENYAVGFRGWEVWIAWLREPLTDSSKPDGGADFKRTLGNAYINECLIDARRAAAIYLRSAAVELGSPAAPPLRRAADHYDRLWRTLDKKRELAPYPWQVTPARPWTAAMRQSQAGLLEEAQALERSAVAEIEAALR
jgi:hypothetical protein